MPYYRDSNLDSLQLPMLIIMQCNAMQRDDDDGDGDGEGEGGDDDDDDDDD